MTTPEQGAITSGETSIPYQIVRSNRRKRTLAFVFNPSLGLQILAPAKANLQKIQSLLQQRSSWIANRLAHVQKQKAAQPISTFTEGAIISYLGRPYQLHITHALARPQGCALRPHHLTVNIHDTNLLPDNLQHEVRLEIMLWLKKVAKLKLQKRTDFWSRALNISYKRLMISNPKGRWGSCSVDNIIRLNWRLILTPLPLLDYVVIHELCHVVHKNHGLRFWQLVGRFIPDMKERRKNLWRYDLPHLFPDA